MIDTVFVHSSDSGREYLPELRHKKVPGVDCLAVWRVRDGAGGSVASRSWLAGGFSACF